MAFDSSIYYWKKGYYVVLFVRRFQSAVSSRGRGRLAAIAALDDGEGVQ